MKRKLEPHFYVGDIVKDGFGSVYKVKIAKFIRHYKNPQDDAWEYRMIDMNEPYNVIIKIPQYEKASNGYGLELVEPSEERLWK
jgi:hypothetical protein